MVICPDYDSKLISTFLFAGSHVKISPSAKFMVPDEIAIGDNVTIAPNCFLKGKLRIGDNVYIGSGSVVNGGEAGVTIDANTMIGRNCTIRAEGDDMEGLIFPRTGFPGAEGHRVSTPIHIGRQVVLGNNCTVNPGVTVRDGGVFKPGAFIDQDTAPWNVYSGSPLTTEGPRPKHLIKEGKNMPEDIRHRIVHYFG